LKWNQRLTRFFNEKGLSQLKTEQCVFKYAKSEIFLAIHVDDGILISKMKKLLKQVNEKFEMTIIENPEVYVGMQLERRQEGIFIHQEKFANKIRAKYNMTDCKIMKTPLAPSSTEDKKEAKGVNFPYRKAVGSLLYFSSRTRPDLSFAVNFESRSIEHPERQDIVNIKKTFRYIQGTKKMGIRYSKEEKQDSCLTAYVDSDFAGCTTSRRSTTGFAIMYNGSPIAWKSRHYNAFYYRS
jgi:Reverse transcriptase (RNA-dependent DNA polymerase).